MSKASRLKGHCNRLITILELPVHQRASPSGWLFLIFPEGGLMSVRFPFSQVGIRYLLTVIALALTSPALAAEGTPIDWAKGAAQETAASCGVMRFEHMRDHETYTLWVKGKTAGSCSFRADGLTFHYPSNYGMTTADTTSIFSFARFGSEVLIAWTPGY
jgi:hypothetical protein